MYFYCRQHQVAYATRNQLNGHWLNSHQGEPRPVQGENEVDQVPPGTRMVEPPDPRPPRVRRRPEGMAPAETPAADNPPAAATAAAATALLDTPSVDEAARLERMLVGIGCPTAICQLIVRGARVFPILLAHPANLATHLDGHLPPNLKRMRDMLVYQFFQDKMEPEGPAPDAPMFVIPNRNGPPQGAMQPAWTFPSNNPRSNGWEQSWNNAPQWRQAKEEAPPEDPGITALKSSLQSALDALEEERAERRREEAARREQEREQAQEDRLQDLQDSFDERFDKMMEVIQGLQASSQDVRTTAEQSEYSLLKGELSAIRTKLEDEKTARLQDTIDTLKTEVAKVQAKIDQGPGTSSKSTEDLISQAIPSVMDRVEEVGKTVKEELGGMRHVLESGRLPSLVPPGPLPQSAAATDSPVVAAARNMAATKTLEDEILNLVNS